jgi:ferritin-like metal-binding protein YciE
MSRPTQKVLQYLSEAHASEMGLIRVLQSQIAMTPRGSYRAGLEKHLRETRSHADRLQRRMRELGQGTNPIQAGIGMAETVIAQALAIGKTPIDLLRGSGGEEKVLKNAKDAAATEALEIATYTALERLARAVGDDDTAELAVSIRADEERMLALVLREIPTLTDAVVRAEIEGDGPYDVTTTGAADAARAAGRATKSTAQRGTTRAKRTTRQTPRARGTAAPRVEELPIARYDALNADEIVSRLPDLSQADLAKVDAYERRRRNRTTILTRVATLRADEPWAGYDELSVEEVRAALADADEARARATHDYERGHKNRVGVLESAEREASNA